MSGRHRTHNGPKIRTCHGWWSQENEIVRSAFVFRNCFTPPPHQRKWAIRLMISILAVWDIYCLRKYFEISIDIFHIKKIYSFYWNTVTVNSLHWSELYNIDCTRAHFKASLFYHGHCHWIFLILIGILNGS